MMRALAPALFMALVLPLTLAASARGADLYTRSNWSALASDRRADKVGDSLIIVISEDSSASNTVATGTSKQHSIGGSINAGTKLNESAALGFGGSFAGAGQTSRAGKMIAQISATVDAINPNGSLHIEGWQKLNINGDTTNIKVSGNIRPEDISGNNTIASSRIADAVIVYDGKGFVSRSAKPSIVTRIFSLFGLL